MTARLIVFDVDGTLIDSQAAIIAGFAGAFRGAGLDPLPDAAILSAVGLSLPEAVSHMLPDADPALVATIVDGYREQITAQRQSGRAETGAPMYPGTRATLERLHADPALRLGVATGKAMRGLNHVFDIHGLRRFFATAQTSDDNPSKPHPGMLLRAAAETGIAPARGIMIGDTEFDMVMGRAAGFATIAVTWGYHPRDRLLAARPDAIVDDSDALGAAIAGLC
jgi:phosphoglycolate phosphatase